MNFTLDHVVLGTTIYLKSLREQNLNAYFEIAQCSENTWGILFIKEDCMYEIALNYQPEYIVEFFSKLDVEEVKLNLNK